MAGKLYALSHFSAGTMNCKYIMETFLTDNKHSKLFVIKQSKECKFIPKMHHNTFGGRAPPWPARGAYARSPSPIRNGGANF